MPASLSLFGKPFPFVLRVLLKNKFKKRRELHQHVMCLPRETEISSLWFALVVLLRYISSVWNTSSSLIASSMAYSQWNKTQITGTKVSLYVINFLRSVRCVPYSICSIRTHFSCKNWAARWLLVTQTINRLWEFVFFFLKGKHFRVCVVRNHNRSARISVLFRSSKKEKKANSLYNTFNFKPICHIRLF